MAAQQGQKIYQINEDNVNAALSELKLDQTVEDEIRNYVRGDRINKTVVSEEGLKVSADKTIYDNLVLDVLLVPSAYDMGDYVGNKNLISFIQKQGESASWMASNCSGAFLLGAAGILDGKKATTWVSGEKDFAKSYPQINVQYDQNAVVGNKVITSDGGPASYQAAFELLTQFSSEKYSKEISEAIQFNRLDRAFSP